MLMKGFTKRKPMSDDIIKRRLRIESIDIIDNAKSLETFPWRGSFSSDPYHEKGLYALWRDICCLRVDPVPTDPLRHFAYRTDIIKIDKERCGFCGSYEIVDGFCWECLSHKIDEDILKRIEE
jgi:hypothetical protein